jgi:hypothetical protein
MPASSNKNGRIQSPLKTVFTAHRQKFELKHPSHHESHVPTEPTIFFLGGEPLLVSRPKLRGPCTTASLLAERINTNTITRESDCVRISDPAHAQNIPPNSRNTKGPCMCMGGNRAQKNVTGEIRSWRPKLSKYTSISSESSLLGWVACVIGKLVCVCEREREGLRGRKRKRERDGTDLGRDLNRRNTKR